jgi:hypothetical protein
MTNETDLAEARRIVADDPGKADRILRQACSIINAIEALEAEGVISRRKAARDLAELRPMRDFGDGA